MRSEQQIYGEKDLLRQTVSEEEEAVRCSINRIKVTNTHVHRPTYSRFLHMFQQDTTSECYKMEKKEDVSVIGRVIRSFDKNHECISELDELARG